jgi:hypothetical protein
MNNPTTTFKNSQIKSFLNRYPTHKELLLHAAFPLALTPDLLYCLRENFTPRTPWIAVSDILLFLCDSVGFQLYEIDPEIRQELLTELKHQNINRLYQLSDFMVDYIREQLKHNYRADEDLGAAPHWTALSYAKPDTAVEEIRKELENKIKTDPKLKLKYASVLEIYADSDPLIAAGLTPLLEVVQGLDLDVLIEEMLAKGGMDYRPLREMLAAGKWKEADKETDRVMLAVMNREKEGWLHVEDIDKFPCEDLRIIDQLWVKYSNGHFGFSVQKEIYQSLGGTRDFNEKVWEKFGDTVGWRNGRKGWKYRRWLYYSDIIFDVNAPKAHLPFKNYRGEDSELSAYYFDYLIRYLLSRRDL